MSPTELEDIIRRMPGVIDVAVVGVPDELAGEIPRAFVVCEKGEHEVTEDSVKKFVHHQVKSFSNFDSWFHDFVSNSVILFFCLSR